MRKKSLFILIILSLILIVSLSSFIYLLFCPLSPDAKVKEEIKTAFTNNLASLRSNLDIDAYVAGFNETYTDLDNLQVRKSQDFYAGFELKKQAFTELAQNYKLDEIYDFKTLKITSYGEITPENYEFPFEMAEGDYLAFIKSQDKNIIPLSVVYRKIGGRWTIIASNH